MSKLWFVFYFILACVISFIAFSLGQWQIHRAQEKLEIERNISQAMNQNTVQLDDLLSQYLRRMEDGSGIQNCWFYREIEFDYSAKPLQYNPVDINDMDSMFLADKSILIDNTINQSVSGLRVITPLFVQKDNSKLILLIDRGWIPWQDRSNVSNISDIIMPVETMFDNKQLKGRFLPLSKDNSYINNSTQLIKQGDLNILLQLNLNALTELIDSSFEIIPAILILDQASVNLQNEFLNSQSYEYIWQKNDDNWIHRHKAYAFQWFSLAVLLWIIYFSLILRYYLKTKKIKA